MNLYDKLWSKEWQMVQGIGPLTHTRYRLMLKELPNSIPDGFRIIDVGCGNGTFLTMLHRKYPNAILSGVEYSKQAREIAPPFLHQVIQIGDIVELAPKLAEEPYDIVVCSEVLEHVPDPALALKAIASLMKPDGIAVFTVPGGMRYWSKQDEVAGHYRRFEYDEFASLVKESGLEVEHHYGWGIPFGLIYDRLVSLVGPEQVMRSGNSGISRIIARILTLIFRIDDLFCSRYGFQLVTKAKYI